MVAPDNSSGVERAVGWGGGGIAPGPGATRKPYQRLPRDLCKTGMKRHADLTKWYPVPFTITKKIQDKHFKTQTWTHTTNSEIVTKKNERQHDRT